MRQLEVINTGYATGKSIKVHDRATGESFTVFTVDLPELLAGAVFLVDARESSRGRIPCLKLNKGNV